MKFGLMFTNTGMGSTRAGAIDLATRAERLGFESLWTVEHVVVPSGYQSPYPYHPSGKMAGGMEEFDLPDPLMWLAFVASATSNIRLATGVLIVPQRNPLILAKEVATLDVLSGGRVTLGVGVGWLEEEFDALGVPFGDRGRRLDDYIEAMRTLWGGGKATVHNTYTSFDECISLPRPANGTVPIVVGGHSKAAARRAARLGDGFFPGNGKPEELADVYALFREACADLGRDPSTIELSAAAGGRGFDDIAARVEQLEALGVSRAVLAPLPGDQLDELAASLRDRFGMALTGIDG